MTQAGPEPWKVGELIHGRWEVFGDASGGMGRVYFVRDREWNGAQLAVKTWSPGGGKDKIDRQRLFLRETQTWLDLGVHSHIVTGYYTMHVDGALCFFMEYVPGTSLKTWLEHDALVASPDDKLKLAIQVATGMAFVHARGVVHRDLTPSNCLVALDGQVRVTDFGLSKFVDSVQPDLPPDRYREHSTALSDRAVGTHRYMAPEQWQALSDAEKPADVYAFGVLLFELFAGNRPFDYTDKVRDFWLGKSPSPRLADLLVKTIALPGWRRQLLREFHLGTPAPTLRDFGVEAPRRLEVLVARCLEKQPAIRPSFAELCTALIEIRRDWTGVEDRVAPIGAMKPTEESENNRAVSYYEMGNVEKAIEILDGWLARDPVALYPWINRTAIAIRQGGDLAEYAPGFFRLVADTHPRVLETDSRIDELHRVFRRHALWHGAPVTGVCVTPDGERIVTGCADGRVRIWDQRIGGPPRELAGRPSKPFAVALSADGQLLATGANDGTVRIWELPEGRLRGVLAGHTETLRTVHYSPDHVLRLPWMPGQTKEFHAFYPSDEWRSGFSAFAIMVTPIGQAAVRLDEAIAIGESEEQAAHTVYELMRSGDAPALLIEGDTWDVTCVAFSPDGRLLATGGADRLVRIWDTRLLELVTKLSGHTARVTSVGFASNEELLSTGRDLALRRWNVRSGAQLGVASGGRASFASLAIEPGRRFAAIGTGDDQLAVLRPSGATAAEPAVLLFDLESGRGRPLGNHPSVVRAVAFSPDGRTLASGSGDGLVQLWSVDDGAPVRRLLPAGGAVTSLAFSPDGQTLAVGCDDGLTRLRDLAGPTPKDPWRPLFLPPLSARERQERYARRNDLLARVRALDAIAYASLQRLRAATPEFRRDGELITASAEFGSSWGLACHLRDAWIEWEARGTRDVRQILAAGTDVLLVYRSRGDVATLDARTGRHIATLGRKGEDVNSVAVSPDGTLALIGAGIIEGGGAQLKRLPSGEHVADLVKGSAVRRVAFSSDGELAFVADTKVMVYQTENWQRLRVLDGDTPDKMLGISSLMPGPRGGSLLCGRDDGTGQIWDARDGRLVHRLEGHTGSVVAAAWSPGGELVVTGDDRSPEARLWGAEEGKLFHVLQGHSLSVLAAAFSRDGRLVATGSGDRSARVWDTGQGRCIANLEGHTDAVVGIEFAGDDRTLLTWSTDHTARLWDSTSSRPLRVLGARSPLHCGGFHGGGCSVITGTEGGAVALWTLAFDYALLEDVLPDAEALVDGAPASRFWPQVFSSYPLEAWLDLWRDLKRSAERPSLVPEWRSRLTAVRGRLLDRLTILARPTGDLPAGWRGGASNRPRLSDVIRHPIHRCGLVDPELAADLAVRLGGDHRAVLSFGWPR